MAAKESKTRKGGQPNKRRSVAWNTQTHSSKIKREPQSNSKTSRKKKDLRKECDFSTAAIGASAGGLEALEGFFTHVTRGCNMSFVVVQHRVTDHKTVRASLIQKYTELKVVEIEAKP